MKIIANAAESECGTGTIVNVVDLDGTVVATYCLIIFGDVTGDGASTGDDASEIELHDGWVYPNDEGRLPDYLDFAGDVTGDHTATGDDASEIELHDGWVYPNDTGRLSQAEIIALF